MDIEEIHVDEWGVDRFKVKNCLLRSVDNDDNHRMMINHFEQTDDNKGRLELTGYAIIPLEEYHELNKLRQYDFRIVK